MRCVCSVSYSVCLNGMHNDWFSPSRGLRQGDPLSPYLFLICAEGFSTLLQEAKQKGCMVGAPIGARVVRDVIHEYEMISGQRVNYDKSLIYFGANVDVDVKEEIIRLLGVRVASSPEKYLGLPIMVGRRKTWAFANFVDRFRKHVEGWSLQYLSIGDILSAKIGSYPSSTWRSICSAKELIEEGVLWRVGKGDHISTSGMIPGYLRERITELEYTVKSGYQVLNTNCLQTSTDRDSNDDDYKDFYNALWYLNIPEKIKIHNWRVFNDMLPHLSNLARRTLVVDIVKVQSFDESLYCNQRFAKTFSAANEQQRRFIRGYTQELDLCQESLHLPQKAMTKDLWRPSDNGVIKINFDASNDGLATVAVVARDSMGEITGAKTYLFENVADPFVAEARAYERTLFFAAKMNFRRLIVEGDSLSVIKIIKKNNSDKSVLRPITQHIVQLGMCFEEISYLYVPRTINGVAHTLALEGRRNKFYGCWVNGVPDSVKMLARKDRLARNLIH
ncbi:reverse transcriptase [Gossypium australe]|uniref:Reverse transcriptase n=1 Tax=Gossypium australe TaxID=47621 RepID=A0A5B6WIS8_9ROSI|nr:reverse transcriptase [Gossypium australe]